MNQEKTNEKRLRILKSAAKLIAQKGYYGVGLKEILDTCGIPKGSFHYFFPGGKESVGCRSFKLRLRADGTGHSDLDLPGIR